MISSHMVKMFNKIESRIFPSQRSEKTKMLRKFSSMWRKEVPAGVPGECVDVKGGG